MGFFSVLGEIIFGAIESGAKSSAQQQYNTARKYANDSSLSAEQRQKAQEMAMKAKSDLEHFKNTQENRDELRKELFDK